MKISNMHQIPIVQKELGLRLERCRIDSGLSQKELSDKAGVGLGTVVNAEKGESITTYNFFKILKALSLLENLDVLLPEAERPSDWLRWNHRPPERVSRKRHRCQR